MTPQGFGRCVMCFKQRQWLTFGMCDHCRLLDDGTRHRLDRFEA